MVLSNMQWIWLVSIICQQASTFRIFVSGYLIYRHLSRRLWRWFHWGKYWKICSSNKHRVRRENSWYWKYLYDTWWIGSLEGSWLWRRTRCSNNSTVFALLRQRISWCDGQRWISSFQAKIDWTDTWMARVDIKYSTIIIYWQIKYCIPFLSIYYLCRTIFQLLIILYLHSKITICFDFEILVMR